jgi:hypothetical protein
MPIPVVNILDTIQDNSEEMHHTQHLSKQKMLEGEVHMISEWAQQVTITVMTLIYDKVVAEK